MTEVKNVKCEICQKPVDPKYLKQHLAVHKQKSCVHEEQNPLEVQDILTKTETVYEGHQNILPNTENVHEGQKSFEIVEAVTPNDMNTFEIHSELDIKAEVHYDEEENLPDGNIEQVLGI